MGGDFKGKGCVRLLRDRARMGSVVERNVWERFQGPLASLMHTTPNVESRDEAHCRNLKLV